MGSASPDSTNILTKIFGKKKNSESSTKQNLSLGISLVIQWLRLYTITAGGAGFIPGLGSKILHAA